MRKTVIGKYIAVVAIVLGLLLSQSACGKDSVEKAVTKTVRAIKAARQVTTEQHEYGHITDAEYVARLRLFRSVYVSADTLGDELAKYGEINNTNRDRILTNLRSLNAAVNQLVQSGDLGVKDPKSKANFAKYALLAAGTLSAIEVIIATAKKPIDVKEARLQRISE